MYIVLVGDTTTISLSNTTKRDLIRVKGKLERRDNKIYSFDKVVKALVKYYNKGGEDHPPSRT